MGMRDLRQLKVWQRSHELALAIYKDSVSSPSTENLRSYKPDAARGQFHPFQHCRGLRAQYSSGPLLPIAMGSASELEYSSCWLAMLPTSTPSRIRAFRARL